MVNVKIQGLCVIMSQVAKFAMRGEDLLRALLDVSAQNI